MRKDTRKRIHRAPKSRKNRRIIVHPKVIPARSYSEPVPYKVAILIIGRIKGYTYVEQQLLNLQKKYKATIFCSINKRTRSAYIDTFCKKFGIADNQLNLEVHPPPPEFLYKIRQSLPTVVPNVYSCGFHKNRCFELMEKFQTKFDYVIYYRADIDNTEDLVLRPVEPNTVYIPAYPNESSRNIDVDGINDQIAYGSFATMKIYCSIFFSLEEMCNQYGVLFHPELYLKKFLIDRNKIQVVPFEFKYTLHIGRYEVVPEYDNFD